ncbi:MAG TPA: hypothetical protein VFC47_05055, partial [Caulobacteraceae bacterium]|nr:hypothetical protein [Caulobacteraceae bacterium]
GELVRQEVDARINLHGLVKEAQEREMRALASAWAVHCELAASEEIGTRGLETHARLDAMIDRAGDEFDQTVEAAVERARGLTSQTARESAADRIALRKACRAATERAVMEAIEGVIRASAPKR